MTNRAQWGALQRDYGDTIELYEIKKNACKFYDCIASRNGNHEEVLVNILNAEKYVNNARRLVRNLFSPQENSLINKEEDNYNEMNEHLGRVDLEIKQMKEDTIKAIRQQGTMVADSPIIKIEDYIKILEEALDNLVYNPLRQAIDKKQNNTEFYTEEDGKKIIAQKDNNFLKYMIYLGILNSSQSMGIPTSQKGKQIIKTFPNKSIIKKEDV